LDFLDDKLAFEEHIQDKIMSLAMQATSYNQELLDDVPDYVRKPTLEPLRNANERKKNNKSAFIDITAFHARDIRCIYYTRGFP